MDNTNLTKILTYLPSSRMEDKEKEMWMALIPHLDNRLLERLAAVLEKEFQYFLEIGLSALKQEV